MGARSGGTTAHAGGRGRVRAAFCLCAALAVGATATAQAQEDPYATVEEQAATYDLDTDVTPVAKETDLWSLVHGAEFRDTEVIEGSVTRFDTELFTVSFRNRAIGLAGGSACAIEPIRQKGEEDAAYGTRVAECRGTDGTQVSRVPALYRYHEPADGDPGWNRLELPGDAEGQAPGYIGAIAWIDSDRALLVGGTGTYPRREAPDDGKAPTDPAKADEAGKARAWLYRRSTDSVEEEIDLSEWTADEPERAGMRGLSAVDCYADPTPGLRKTAGTGLEADPEPDIELCFAGGLGQIWEWQDGGFTGKRVDARSPSADLVPAADLVNPTQLRFRVRDLAFSGKEPPIAIAATSGCCGGSDIQDHPQILTYNHDPTYPRGAFAEVPNGYSPAPPRWSVAVNDRPGLPNSYYSLTMWKTERYDTDVNFSVIASPGGAETGGEDASAIVQSPDDGGQSSPPSPPSGAIDLALYPVFGVGFWAYARAGGVATAAAGKRLSTARLVSGDGDVAGRDPFRPPGQTGAPSTSPSGPDGIPDWAVGEQRSTRLSGLGARGLVVATALPPSALDPVNEGRGAAPPNAEEVIEGEYQALDQEKFDAYLRSRHYLLPSYSANAIEIVGAQEDGWAVGDHGAILRLSATATNQLEAAAEPKPPKLGQPRQAALSDRDAYAGSESTLPDTVGAIPRFGAETTELEEPRMVPAGGPRGTVVMSRDGSEGWAFANNAGGPVLSHFDGVGWSNCEIGAETSVEGDPMCAGLAGLRGWRDESGLPRTTEIVAAQRIPLENDDDPTNDDELEILAATSGQYRGPETEGNTQRVAARYVDGRWEIEAEVVPPSGTFAFAAPDEGWAFLAGTGSQGTSEADPAHFYRFDGERWIECSSVDPGQCGNQGGRLPPHARNVSGLAVAGERIYIYGQRVLGASSGEDCAGGINLCTTNREVPMIIYRGPGGEWTDGSARGEDGGGFDPGFADSATRETGGVEALSVTATSGGGFEGWAVGAFESGSPAGALAENVNRAAADTIGGTGTRAVLMRLEDGASHWQRFRSPGPLEDYLLGGESSSVANIVGYPSQAFPEATYIGDSAGRIYGFDEGRQRFRQLQTGRAQGLQALYLAGFGRPRPAGGGVTASDQQGGFWSGSLHYTDRAPAPVFAEQPSPLGPRGVGLADLAGAPDGSVWVATASDRIFRHDRIAGWEEVRVPGWDPGRVVTRPSRARAIAFGPDGGGLVVGEGGRIARLSAEGVALDAAAGRSCALGEAAPCSTSRDLRAVEIAPDGSAIAAGERLSLLWRPPGGSFQAIAKPPIASATTIIRVSFPTPTRAYLVTDRGIIFRGDLDSPDRWRWRADNVDHDGKPISVDAQGEPLAIADLVVDASGHGYAVGEDGMVLERSEQGGWKRLPTRFDNDLTAIELPQGGGEGVLIGGADGLILAGDPANPHLVRPQEGTGGVALAGDVAGFAYLPGSSEGSVDAWTGLQGSQRILRYRSDPLDPGLGAVADTPALADAPPPSPGELSVAAFGKSDCEFGEDSAVLCPEMTATTTTNELISQRIVDALDERRERGELDVALHTGDAVDSAGLPASSLADLDRLGSADTFAVNYPSVALSGQLKHRRYAELVSGALEDEGVPVFGAIGANDLTEAYACNADAGCERTKRFADAGENYGWREGFGGRAAPWGDETDTLGEGASASGEQALSFEPAPGSEDNSLAIEDQSADADGEGSAPEAKAEIGGANTHYAVDAIRDGEAIARIVFVDTSLRSLAASDPLQQPHELAGGQLRFLERMICRQGDTTTTAIDECTRGPDQKAIVVSNTPTYSYGPGALTHTATDANVFEALMLKHRVDLVVSGALGLNGLYYTLAPGVHEPCPGGSYPAAPPGGQTPDCLAGPTSAADAATAHSPAKAPDPASLIAGQGLAGAYPTLIASGAGGKFGSDGGEPADGPAGQWHGYSLARFLSSGDLVVEQRPILDWIGIDAPDHAVAPKSRLKLNGYGRSPISTTTTGQRPRAFHYAISTPAITHRYDLVLADPDAPWLPCEEGDINCQELHANLSKPSGEAEGTPTLTGEANPCSPHLCLPSRIGVVDDQSGLIRAGDGKYPETFAIAMLSVDDEVATYPLVFTRSPSFVATPALRSGALPNTAGTRPTAPPPPPPPPGLPQIPQVDIPQIPPPPGIPQLTAATPPELQPPAPPAPPPPSQQPAPLDLSVAPPGVSISTPTALIQPPTPPVNPAPPGGARREARQRQAAAQKGGADSDSASEEGANESSDGDLANNRPGVHGASRIEAPADASRHAFSQRSRSRPEPSFTALSRATHASDGPGPLPITAGLTIAALALALGFTTLRPGSRRREPEVPAPAYRRPR